MGLNNSYSVVMFISYTIQKKVFFLFTNYLINVNINVFFFEIETEILIDDYHHHYRYYLIDQNLYYTK